MDDALFCFSLSIFYSHNFTEYPSQFKCKICEMKTAALIWLLSDLFALVFFFVFLNNISYVFRLLSRRIGVNNSYSMCMHGVYRHVIHTQASVFCSNIRHAF